MSCRTSGGRKRRSTTCFRSILRKVERLNAELRAVRRPLRGRTTFTYYPGRLGPPAGSAPNLLNKSWSVTADIKIPQGAANGVVWAMGALDGGFTLYVKNGKPVFTGNFLGRTYSRATSTKAPARRAT